MSGSVDVVRADGWIETPYLAPDYRGPVDPGFERFTPPESAPPIIELLRRMAERHPNGPAFADDVGSLDFAALWRAVRRLAHRLDAVPADRPVGVLLPAGILYPVAVFACLAARRMCLLLDAGYPPERCLDIATDAQAGLLLVDERPPPGNWPCELLDVRSVLAEDVPLTAVDASGVDLDGPRLMLATSGSTGRPKLIVHAERTALHWVRSVHDSTHLVPQDAALTVSSPSSLGGIMAMLALPLAGASTRMFDIKHAGFGGLLDILAEGRITILRCAPSLLRALTQHPERAHPALAGVRLVQTYGEPLLKSDIEALRPVLAPGCLIRANYGSTESSGLSWFAGDPDEHHPTRVASGVLFPDTRAKIIGLDGSALGPGEVGELLIASRYNALGEWVGGRLISGRLEADPSDPRARIYRTGDEARYSPDGVFVVLGRRDRMININGQRVEPSEIETVLRRQDSVEAAEVVADTTGERTRLIAFVVPKGTVPDGLGRALRRRIVAALPAYMVPSRIVLIERIPQLPGGKTDIAALLRMAAHE